MPPPSIKERRERAAQLERERLERERERQATFDRRYKELLAFLRWASTQFDEKGRSLLERARESMETGSYKKYVTKVDLQDKTFKCTCPDHYYRGRICKHMVVRAIIMNLDVVFEKSPEWKEFITKKMKIYPAMLPDTGRLDDRKKRF